MLSIYFVYLTKNEYIGGKRFLFFHKRGLQSASNAIAFLRRPRQPSGFVDDQAGVIYTADVLDMPEDCHGPGARMLNTGGP